MKIKSFLMIFTILAISPVLFAQENSSWSDFCADVVWVKDLCMGNLTVSGLDLPKLPNVSVNGADVACWSAPAWAGFGLWVKGFNYKNPIKSTKAMFNIDPATKRTELVRLALNNKAYGMRLAIKKSSKVAAAAYLTGFAWHALVNSDKK